MSAGAIHLVENLRLIARARPDDPAVIDGERIWSFAELHRAATNVAVVLRRAGIGRGDIVALRLEDSALYLIVIYALMRVGAIAQPLDLSLTNAERSLLLRRFGAKAIIAAPGAMAVGEVPMLAASEAWLAATADPNAIDDVPFDPTLPCHLATSSGTTGAPKGFFLDHVQQKARFRFYAGLGIGRGDRHLAAIGLHFSVGLRSALGAIDLGGVAVVNQGLTDAASFVTACLRRDITWTYMVPVYLRMLVDAARGTRLMLPRMRCLIVTGAKLWDQERRAIREHLTPNLYETFGANETGAVTVASPADQDMRPGSVGRGLPGWEVEAVGPDDAALPPGELGELRMRGPGLVAGYVGDAEASTRQFRDGWFYSGDLGSVDGDGYVTIGGRADDRINFNGIKFHPAEVEAVLLAHPAVAEAAVVGWITPRQQEVPIGFVVRRGEADQRGLIDFCRSRLAAYKIPMKIIFMPELPKTGSGKVLRRELRARLDRLAAR